MGIAAASRLFEGNCEQLVGFQLKYFDFQEIENNMVVLKTLIFAVAHFMLVWLIAYTQGPT